MKTFFFLVNVFSVLGLILAQGNATNTTTTEIEECKIYYSAIGEKSGRCCINLEQNSDITYEPYSICENGHITEFYANGKHGIYIYDIFKLKNLKVLDLTNGSLGISELPGIQELTELEELYFGGNNVERFPDEILKLKKLKKLDLNVGIAPPSIQELTELEYLSSGNSEISNELCKLKKLKVLNLQNGAVEKIPPAIQELTELEELYLGGCAIKEIPNELFNLKKLKVLNLGTDGVEKIPPNIQELTELEKLSLDIKNINELPNELFKLKKLKELELPNNHLEKIPPAIQELTELEKLNLNGGYYDDDKGKIKELPNELFKLKKLKDLDLSYQEIETIPSEIGELTELEHLDLSYNKIKNLPKEFSNLKKLNMLNLNYNYIDKIPEEIKNSVTTVIQIEKRKSKLGWIIVIGIIVLLCIIFGIYCMLRKKNKKQDNEPILKN